MQAAEAIRRVKVAQDHYAVLGVTRNATPEEIKKAYRKISLVLHPDKCTDPSKQDAYSEAFKKVGAAHSVLSKPESRRVYDNPGDDGIPGATPHQSEQQYQQGRRPGQQAPRQQDEGEATLGFLIAIPLLLLIAVNFALNMGGQGSTGVDNMFNLTRDPRNGFIFERHVEEVPEVENVDVVYYVRGDFDDERLRRNHTSTRSVELQVVVQARNSLGRCCRSELQSMHSNAMRSAIGRPQSCNDYDELRRGVERANSAPTRRP